MARRDANLAGLASLGALGYLLSKGDKKMAPVEDRSTMADLRDQEDIDLAVAQSKMPKKTEDDLSNLDIEMASPKAASAPKSAGTKKTAAPRMMSREDEAKIRASGGPRGVRYSPTDTGDETGRLAARVPKSTRPLSYDERVAQIPTDAGKYAPVRGEKIDSTELGRNVSNALNATAGLSVPGYVGKMTQPDYNALAAARRSAEGFSPAEAIRRKKMIEEAAAAGGLKSGGKVKKMASGGMAKAEKPAAKGWGKARSARGAKYY